MIIVPCLLYGDDKLFDVSGNATASGAWVSMQGDNLPQTVGGYYPGINPKLNFVIMGKMFGADVIGLTDMWYGVSARKFNMNILNVEVSKENTRVNLGHFYPKITEYTMYYNQKILGARTSVAFELMKSQLEEKDYTRMIGSFEDTSAIEITPMDVYDRLRRQKNVGRLELQAFGGLSREGEDTVGGNYRQYLGCARVSGNPSSFATVGLSYIYAQDDVKSLTIKNDYSKPLSNHIVGPDLQMFFLGEWLKCGIQGYFSVYDKDIDDTAVANNDYSAEVSVGYRFPNVYTELIAKRVGNNYFSAGNPYLVTDKIGGQSNTTYKNPEIVDANLSYEYYFDNITRDAIKPVTNTHFLDVKVEREFLKMTKPFLRYRLIDKRSNTVGFKRNQNQKNQASAGLNQKIMKTTQLGFNFDYVRYRDTVNGLSDYDNYSPYLSVRSDVIAGYLALSSYVNMSYYRFINKSEENQNLFASVRGEYTILKDILLGVTSADVSGMLAQRELSYYSTNLQQQFRIYISSNVLLNLEYKFVINETRTTSPSKNYSHTGNIETTVIF